MPTTPFQQARQVFDECDSLRESYWDLRRRGDERGAAKVKEKAMGLLDTLALDAPTAGAKSKSKKGDIDKQWSYTRGEAAAEHNRWANVRPWDHAMLPEPYLNASTIPPLPWTSHEDVRTLQSYIASQAPLPNTMLPFWHHLLSSGARLLVNLTPVYDTYEMTKVRKSHQYWPDRPGTSFYVGDGWNVELLSQTKHTTRNSSAQRVGQSSHTPSPRPELSNKTGAGSSSSGGSSDGGGSSGGSLDNRGKGPLSPPRTSPAGQKQEQKDWVIVKREIRIHPPPEWEPAPLASYLDVLYDPSSPRPHQSRSAAVNRADAEESGWDLTLLHVDTWADGAADSGLNFCRLVDLVQETQDARCPAGTSPLPPIWVHCSAGIGRTGTLIAGLMARSLHLHSSDPSLRSCPAEKMVLILWRHLRERRYGMITTPQQAMMVAEEIERIRQRSA